MLEHDWPAGGTLPQMLPKETAAEGVSADGVIFDDWSSIGDPKTVADLLDVRRYLRRNVTRFLKLLDENIDYVKALAVFYDESSPYKQEVAKAEQDRSTPNDFHYITYFQNAAALLKFFNASQWDTYAAREKARLQEMLKHLEMPPEAERKN